MGYSNPFEGRGGSEPLSALHYPNPEAIKWLNKNFESKNLTTFERVMRPHWLIEGEWQNFVAAAFGEENIRRGNGEYLTLEQVKKQVEVLKEIANNKKIFAEKQRKNALPSGKPKPILKK